MSSFQYKLEDRSTVFSDDAVWEDDKLGREAAARRLHRVISGQERPLTICLNGEWGSGKTFFLKRFERMYNMLEPKGRSVYFNAWQDDFLEDPLIAIVSQLKSAAVDEVSLAMLDAVKDAAGPCLIKIGLAMAKQFIKNKTGIDVDAIEVDDLKSNSEAVFDQYEQLEKSRRILRTELEKFAKKTWEDTQKPVLFIVDELDRCRPTFAIELLERIKHLFSVPHLVFVIGADARQLGKSIKAVYGEIDANDYLHRFFDLELKLPPADKMSFAYALWDEHGLADYAARHGTPHESQSNAFDEFAHLVKYRGLSLRQIEKSIRTYAFLLRSKDKLPSQYGTLAAIAIVLKVTDIDAYEKFFHGEFEFGELLEYLYPGFSYNNILNEQGVLDRIQYLSKIAYYVDERTKSHQSLEKVKNALLNKTGLAFDKTIMPKCFETCSSDELDSFYRFVFINDENAMRRSFALIPEVLARIDSGLQFLV